MEKSIEQYIQDGNTAFNKAVKIMLQPEIKRIAEMEEELLKDAVEMIKTDESNIDFKIFVCPTISHLFKKHRNFAYEIEYNKTSETEIIEDCISNNSDLYTSVKPRVTPLFFNTFVKQTLNEQGYIKDGVYDTIFNGRNVRYRITFIPATEEELKCFYREPNKIPKPIILNKDWNIK